MPEIEKSFGVKLELKDLDTSKRTAIIRHAVYTSIDRVKDISTKGMFTKSWQEGLPDFLFNHQQGAIVGPTLRTFEDESAGFTEVKFGRHTLGNDVLEMADEGILKGASFGYITQKSKPEEIKGQRVRRLTEVKHVETSLLTVLPAHPEAGIFTLNKAFEDSASNDITSVLQWHEAHIAEMKAAAEQLDKYCRKAKASDESIITLLNQLNEYKQIISQYDTALTHVANEPGASDDEVKAMLMRARIALAS